MFKKLLILVTIFVLLTGCGGSSQQGTTLNDIPPPPPPPTEIMVPRISHLSPFNTVEADILTIDDVAFIADGINPMRVFEFSDGIINEILITGGEAFGATRLVQRGDSIIAKGAALTPTGGQVRFYLAQDNASIVQVGESPDFVAAGGLYTLNDLLLTGGSGGDGISSYRFTSPSAIEFIANEPVEGPISDIVGFDNTIFAISQSNIYIYTVSNEGDLIFSGIYPVTITAYKADISEKMLFYSDGNRAKVLDVSNPLAPVQLFESAEDIENLQIIPVKYYHNHMYIGGLKVVDVFKNTDGVFEKVGTIETENEVTALSFIGNYLIVINSSRAVSQTVPEGGPSSMEVFDISSIEPML